MLGVMKRVIIWANTIPPTTTRPSGIRLEASAPYPIAIGNGAENGAQAGHQDRAETHQARVINRVITVHALGLALQGKVHHQNAVLGDQPDQNEHADIRRKAKARRSL